LIALSQCGKIKAIGLGRILLPSSEPMPGRPGTPRAFPPLGQKERLELANRLFHEYRARCFWHCPPDLVITEQLVPLVVKGLRKHGGRRGFILAARLEPGETPRRMPEGEDLECH
jgi:hypothetical protein